jgi:hypothetical protein
MLLKLYETTEAMNVINKELAVKKEIDIRLRGQPDLINPSILLRGAEYEGGYNYAMFNDRFYFVESVELVSGDLFRLTLRLDVLETFKGDILESNSRFLRNLKNGDNVGQIDFAETKTISQFNGEKGFSDLESTMILTVIKG